MNEATGVPESVEKTAGEHLRAAREAAGLRHDEVALKLKLSVRQVVAIEAQDWEALPERTFTRGFFRSYARLVGVDEQLIEPSFARASPTSEVLPRPERVGEVTMIDTSARSRFARWAIPLALLACVCAGVAWMLWHDLPRPQAMSKLPISAAANAAKQASEEQRSAAEQKNTQMPNEIGVPSEKLVTSTADSKQNSPSVNGSMTQEALTIPILASSTLPSAPGGVGAVPLNPNPTSAASPSPATPSVATAAPLAAATTAPSSSVVLTAGQKRINLVVKGRSWTEVRSRGETVLSEMLDNTSREIASRGPISFVIGNSSNVTLFVDGKPYDFSMHVRNEVARFRIE
jgi:cytoskeleton protein RodZ